MNNFKLDTEQKITKGFIIPNDYFEKFSDRLQPKLVTAPIKIISFNDFIKQNKNWIVSTAALLIISISSVLYLNFQSKSNQKYTAELENYITNHPNYSDDEIVDLLDSDQIKSIEFDSKLNNETIENQLIENGNLEEIITN